ncbi:MAG: hypothetical protein HKO59_14540 [Phycisphaerales bacterium]|nr:hypothetical protein [Phycisphaerae bacterium]NNF42705.1 hypothetical protein [Phycisphaerales bacterium]NNM27179.1 hypothetical protein [Phycisphaerales bacterium]
MKLHRSLLGAAAALLGLMGCESMPGVGSTADADAEVLDVLPTEEEAAAEAELIRPEDAEAELRRLEAELAAEEADLDG